MRRTIRSILLAIIACIFASQFISGCSSPCTYPVARSTTVRILNAMPNEPVITVFINGKLFVQNYTYDPQPDFGYLGTYKDGTPLSAGDSLLFIVTSDAAGKDTLLKQRVFINFNRQTLIVMGRGHAKPLQPKPPLIIRLDDQIDQPDPTHTLIRFVDAVPELDSMDIFFRGDTSTTMPLGKPDLTIHYGQVQPHIVLNSVAGLTITQAGNPNNVIFSISYPFAFPGFFITSVVRGADKPIGTEFTAAPIVLSDASIGNYIFNFKTFAVRLVNASRTPQLSLLIRSTYISPENTYSPRANYPNQDSVFNISPGQVSGYLPMNFNLDSIAGYWFSKTTNPNDTVASSIDKAQANGRYSKIAVEENVFSQPSKVSYLNLPDTMTNPAGNFGRVRVIHLSPDHSTISVTLGNRTNVSMVKKQVEFFDVPVSSPTITVKDGATTKTFTIPVSAITPISVYLLPEQSATPALPIATSQD